MLSNSGKMSFISMQVIKRNGSKEDVSFDKVLNRIRIASKDLEVNPTLIAQRTLARIYDGVKTSELDELAAQLSISLMTTNPDYGTLASRIAISNHHRNTSDKFTEVVFALANQTLEKTGEKSSIVSNELVELCEKYGEQINTKIDYNRDYLFDYFGFKTLEKLQYLIRDVKGKTLERPQHLIMRVSLALWGSVDLERAFETYDLLSHKYFIHATPTNFNAGTKRQQLSSCFLLAMKEDSIAGIYDTLKDCAMISKNSGGIGLHIHNIRAKGALIKGTNGTSNGIVPMLRNFNDTARYCDQCFTPDTLVYTENGPKLIEDVSVSDKILTSEGVYHKVKMPIRHEYNGKMLEIQIKNAIYPIRLTPEHQILALQKQTKCTNYSVIRNRLEKAITKAEFVDAKDLKEADFVVFPIPTYEKDIEEISEDDCRFYGIMLGDGHISSAASGVTLNNTTKTDTLEFVKEYLINRGIKYNTYEDDNCVDIKWSTATPRFKFTRNQLYDSEGHKKWDIPLLHLPITKVKQILRGIIETDGCVGEKEIAIELSSLGLIESIRYVLLRMGALSSGYTRNRVGNVSNYKNITTRLPTNVIRVPRIKDITDMFPNAPKGEFFSYLTYDNYLYSRIENISEVNYEGVVHDFEIDGPHDYVVSHLGIAHNGGGKRNGSFAIYLEPWHADVEDFLKLKLNTGSEEERCRDLFYALWIPDLFMERVEKNEPWTLFCPSEAPGLADVYGDEFKALYEKYEKEGRGRKQIDAQKLWFKVLDSQIETGTPYILYKDASNKKSNQKNLGTIKSSNLCVAPETLVLTKEGEYPIIDLENKDIEVWNGDKWSKTTVMKTGENQPLMSIDILVKKSKNNSYTLELKHIECTQYHKFLVKKDRRDCTDYIGNRNKLHPDYIPRTDAEDLCRGDCLIEWITPEGDICEAIVWNVKYNSRCSVTYCFNEPDNHAGVFNGVLTGNCTEIIEYSNESETAVCNLASIALPMYVEKKTFNYEKLREVVKVAIKNLNRVIDINYYPTPETRNSNMRHRPVGLGVQGLADVFALMRIPWESDKASNVNQRIFEHIYYAAVESSSEIAEKEGPYLTYEGSPMSKGEFQYDLWNVTPLTEKDNTLDWKALKEKVAKHGVRNSLMVAPMPTASTSQILGFNECIEPFTSNIYTRRTLAGEFIIVNKHLMKDLEKYDLWNENMKQQIIARNGSIQGIEEIPDAIQKLYKTSWEIKQKTLIDMATARGAFICQSQSLNLFVADPNYAKLTSMHFYSWKQGLKTGIYYLRTRAPVMAQKFTIDPDLQKAAEKSEQERIMRKCQSDEGCTMCSA
jgi:ribonucleotide reductase alpha subunit